MIRSDEKMLGGERTENDETEVNIGLNIVRSNLFSATIRLHFYDRQVMSYPYGITIK